MTISIGALFLDTCYLVCCVMQYVTHLPWMVTLVPSPGVCVYSSVEVVPSEEEGSVLLPLPRPAPHPAGVCVEEALPRSHRLGGGAHHWDG